MRGGSSITISASTWELYDQSRVFITDSSLSLEAGATLRLLNSTITLINSTLEVKGGSEVRCCCCCWCLQSMSAKMKAAVVLKSVMQQF